jgi:hypothetical protein
MIYHSKKFCPMNSFANISWGLEDNVQEAILALDLPLIDNSNGLIDTSPGNLETCPICENKLGLSAPAF